MRKKIKSQRAETLVEAMLSLLIVMLSMGLLTTCVMAATNINEETRAMDEKYSTELQIAEGLMEEGYTAKEVFLSIRFEKGVGNAERNKSVKVTLYGADDSSFISYQYEGVSSP